MNTEITWMRRALALIALGALVPRCSSYSPTGQGSVQLAVFTDPQGGFSTSDVLDVNAEVVRFDLRTSSLIWAATGAEFSGFPVSGNRFGATQQFEVRFGAQNGQPHAYFTETATAHVCDLSVAAGQLVLLATGVPVPH